MTTKKEKRLIVVLGMHRSGTSAVARSLQVLGVELGDNLMPAVQNVNEKGFWEDLDLYALNNELLETLHSEWHYLSPFMPRDLEILRANGYIAKAGELLLKKIEKREVFGFKDPKTAKLLDFWKEVFHQVQLDPTYVLALRHPLSVAKSLAKRDEFDAEKGYYLWLEHVLASLSGTVGTKRVLVDYDKLVQSPEFQINRIGEQINLTVNLVELKRYISEFLDKTLRHTVYDLSDLSADDSCPALAREMYATLINVASDSIHLDDPALLPHVENWTKEFQRLKPALALVDKFSAQNLIRKEINTQSNQDLPLNQTQTITERNTRLTRLAQAVIERDNRIEHLNQTVLERDSQINSFNETIIERDRQLADLSQAHLKINARIAAIENSTFWRVTSPLRRALAGKPALRKFGRRAAELLWWARKLELGQRLRKLRTPGITNVETPHFAPPTDDYCLVVPLDYSIDGWEAVPSIAIICHMYYVDLTDEIKRYLTKIPFPFDLFITTDSQEKQLAIESHFNDWHQGAVEIRITPNRGRDIAPKLIACRDVYIKYEFILHIHTKKSPHTEILSGWRSYLFETLLGSEKIVESIFEAFRSDPKLGLIAPQHFEPVRQWIGWGWNFKEAERFARRLDIKISLNGRLDFPSGSMFWARSAALKPLLDCNLCLDEFPSEADQEDGTLGHVIERLYFFVSERASYRWIKIAQPALMNRTEGMKSIQSQDELLNFIKNTQYGLLKFKKRQVLRLPFIALKNNSFLDKKKDSEQLAYERSSYKFIDFSRFQHELKLHIEKKDSLIDFDDDFYLKANLDVAASVAEGVFSCGFIHYCLRGQYERRIWSDNQLKRRFSMSPNFPDGFTAPIHIRPLPQSNIDLSHLPKNSGAFLLIFFSHLQDDLFFAGYTAFFQDFKPLFGKFSKVILSVESERFDPRLAKRHSDLIEVVQEKELECLKYQPDLIVAFNSQLFIKALQIFNNPNRTVYYCQDFESGFFPYGEEYVEAEKAIASSQNIIVSTKILESFFIKNKLLDRQRVYITSPKIEPLDVREEKTKRLFFYFRPESFHRRNLPQTVMEAVENFCRKHIGYEIFLVGSVNTRYSYKINDTPVYVINKLPKKEYFQLISSCDVVVSMIYSAHPGVIAFQSAASGIPTVTNVFENRDADLLKRISENILPYDPIREDLLEIIEIALTMKKGKKSFNDRLYSGHNNQSLNDYVDVVLSSDSDLMNL